MLIRSEPRNRESGDRMRRGRLGLALAALTAVALGCIEEGATEFVSADPEASYFRSGPAVLMSMSASGDALDSEARSVEEGDIYRVWRDALILNLNGWRGLQVIDVSDVDLPEVIGVLPLAGDPVEMYIQDDHALVLLNRVTEYTGVPGEPEVEVHSGSVVLLVDLADPTHPAVLDRVPVTAGIRTSRLSTWQGQTALYLVSSGWARWREPDGTYRSESRHVLQSIEVSGDLLVRRSELNLGSYVTALQATREALLVARKGDAGWGHVSVQVVDIRDPGGVMVEGDRVELPGEVSKQFQLDLHEGVLRVVSGSTWNANVNTFATFDASDIHDIRPIDRAEFAEGEDLFATLFLPDRAFFVTYLRVDPFHAFEIEADGAIHERAEYVVSGWNDYFRAVSNDRRLVGIGVDDTDGREAAVSLYDITDLSNPAPLITRARVGGSHGWSEAHWDHRAFSVLEGAVEATAPDATPETGLVLLPYSGWRSDLKQYENGVQILTFSESTLTLRGRMAHDEPVRRSFQPERALTANLSSSHLALFDTTSTDEPEARGSVLLAPTYSHLLVFGDHAVRIEGPNTSWTWYGVTDPEPSEAQVIPADGHPDAAVPLATFPIRGNAHPYAVGDLLVTVDTRGRTTTIEVFDLADPTDPQRVGELVTDTLEPAYPWFYWGGCVACDMALFAPTPYPYTGRPDVIVVEGGLVFLQRESQHGLVGTSDEPVSSCPDDGSPCLRQPDLLCLDCRHRYWNQFILVGLDLTTPSEPLLSEPFALPKEDEGLGLVVDGSTVWVSFVRPEAELDEDRPCVRHYLRRVDFSLPALPALDGEPINVPGELVAIDGDAIFTRDRYWLGESAEYRVNRLRLDGDVAVLEASRTFVGKWLSTVALDGAGSLLAQYHASGWSGPRVAVLDAASDDLDVQSLIEVPSWGNLLEALPGRPVFRVEGGLLLYDLDDPEDPLPLSHLATRAWDFDLAQHARRLLVAAGAYGAYAVDLDAFALPPPAD